MSDAVGRVLVLQHHDDDGIELLGRDLRAHGLVLDVVAVHAGQTVPDSPDHDALVVLGGEMNVWQEDRHPWLADEKALIRRWTDDDRGPLLGICLGHQLLADALGGRVGPMGQPEAGISSVAATPDGARDALIGPLGPTWPVLQWHGAEVTSPPPGATVLATNTACAIQALRVGTRWWGVQFHPEVGPAGAAAWGADPAFHRVLGEARGSAGVSAFAEALAGVAPGLAAVTASLAGVLAAATTGAPPVSTV